MWAPTLGGGAPQLQQGKIPANFTNGDIFFLRCSRRGSRFFIRRRAGFAANNHPQPSASSQVCR